MALIRLEEAIDLGLVPQSAMSRFPAVGRSQLFGSPLQLSFGSLRGYRPWVGPLERGLGTQGRFGIAPPRFGLGPLMSGLGLSPAASAVGAPGAVPVGRTMARRPRTDEEQALIEQALARSGALPTARGRSVPGSRVAPVGQAVTTQTGPSGASLELAQLQRGLGFAKLGSQVLGTLGTTPEAMGRPEAIEEAYQAYRRGEREDLSQVSPEAIAILDLAAMPPDVAAALEGLTPDTLAAIQSLRAAREATPIIRPDTLEDVGMTAGGSDAESLTRGVTGREALAGIQGLSGGAQIAAAFIGQGDPLRRGLSGAQGLLSAAQAARAFNPEAFSDLLGPTAESAVGAAGPALGFAGGLAGAAEGFAGGDIGKGVLGLTQTGIQALANPSITNALGLTGGAAPALSGAALEAGLIGAEEAFAGASAVGLAAAEAAPLIASAGPYAAAAVAAYMVAKGLATYGPGGYGVGSLFSGGPPRGLVTDVLQGFGVPLNYGPSKEWLSFGGRLGQTLQIEHDALQGLIDSLKGSKTQGDLTESLQAFRKSVGRNVGGYGQDVPDIYTIPALPGAGGSQHEWGQSAEFGPAVVQVQDAINQLRTKLPAGGASPYLPSPPANPAAQPIYQAFLNSGYTRSMAQTYGDPASLAERGLTDPDWLRTHLGTVSYYTGFDPQAVGSVLGQTSPPPPEESVRINAGGA